MIKNLVQIDLIDSLNETEHKNGYHKLICTFGDSFNLGQGPDLNLETILTL